MSDDKLKEIAERLWPKPNAFQADILAALQQARDLGSSWLLEAIRGSLRAYPNCGGDIEVMREVARIQKEARDLGREEAYEQAAILHESINNDCDRDCGCGAMGAVIEYRDAIRARSEKS